MGKADLHTHTTYSDGACNPAHLVKLAAEKSLSVLSITDHDSIEGYLSAKSAAEEYGIELLPGVEITTVYKQKEIHILAYCFDPGKNELHTALKMQRKARLKRMFRILNIISKKGIDISIEEVIAEAGNMNVGRPHLAAVMIKKRYVHSLQEAFIRYLASDVLGDIHPEYISVQECIELIKNSCGFSSLAHPSVLGSNELVSELIGLGLDGIECIHPSHNFDDQKTFIALAKANNLLITGGSDFHGNGKAYDPYFGIVTLSLDHVQSLKRLARRRKEIAI